MKLTVGLCRVGTGPRWVSGGELISDLIGGIAGRLPTAAR
jgi:hypothetical protein